MQLVDARGLDCPKPVLLTRKALDQMANGVVRVMVDNAAARDNLMLMAESGGYGREVRATDFGFEVDITKSGDEAASQPGAETCHGGRGAGPLVVVVSSDQLGRGAEELGEVLMRSFFVALAEGPVPDTIIFLNSGVRLSTEGSPVLENLAVLAAKGVEILSCGTCLNYYQLSEKLVSGKVSNMYTIVERLAAAGRTINW
jgi:selenium metabolism protein YedF